MDDNKSQKRKTARKKAKKKKKILRIVERSAAVLLSTAAVILLFLCSVIMIVNYGPSERAHKLFVNSVRETSALKFLANWVTSDSELAAIISENSIEEIHEEVDTSLIHIATNPTPAGDSSEETADTESPDVVKKSTDSGSDTGKTDSQSSDGYTYENVISNEDGIIICEITGSTYYGHMMIVLDPSRVFVGTCAAIGKSSGTGERLANLVERYGAVAGVNAGGFQDDNGQGSGTIPLGYVYSQGKLVYNASSKDLLIGFDNQNILHVGTMDVATANEKGIRDAVTFGPALIVNGTPAKVNGLGSGLNPRTGIGQRADGAVLLLVIDGRQADSLGASYSDMIDIFTEFGAVNAANLDGGSSSLMIYKGEEISSKANITGDRNLPTCILVK